MKHVVTLLLALLVTPLMLQAQVKIGDNLTNINANSILELESTTKALLMPRLDQNQIDAMQNVPAGMLVYNSTTNVLNIRTNTGWTTLALAANAASATNPWSTSGSVAYTTASKVGIGTVNPSSQLSNNSGNTSGSDGQGGNTGSLSWSASQGGYVGQFYNGSSAAQSDGLVVKVNSTTATALDVSQGPQNGSATPLLTVKSDGKVGIGKSNPSTALDVNGNITATTIGVGTNQPYSQLANNSGNTTGSDGVGGGGGSLSWAASQQGYVGQFYNGASATGNGVIVKVNSTNVTALEVAKGSQNGNTTSLLTVNSNGKVGIGTNGPSEALEVNGNIKYSGNLQMGAQYIYAENEIPASSIATTNVGCPTGSKLIGGGGGLKNNNGVADNVNIAYSGPQQDNNNNWLIVVTNKNSINITIRTYAICAKVQ